MNKVATAQQILKIANELTTSLDQSVDEYTASQRREAADSLVSLAERVLEAEDEVIEADDQEVEDEADVEASDDDLDIDAILASLEEEDVEEEPSMDINAYAADRLLKLAEQLAESDVEAEESGSGVPDEDNDLKHPADYASWGKNPTKKVKCSSSEPAKVKVAKVAKAAPAPVTVKTASQSKKAAVEEANKREKLAKGLLRIASELEELGL